jgi:hypothetical protein
MPKVFISYSWTSNEHQQWVLDLATALRDNGVDAIFDKWDLKEGHDSIAFMERMVTDSTVDKVIMVLDRRYAEKADDRKGGVGTETQIITPQIYASADQNKFVGVVSEVGADGKPFKPTYYASRIHIDLSNEDIYAENFEQLLRWIFNKPVFPKPALGKQRISARGISLDDLMQADLVLFIRAIVQGTNRWWPESLVWSSRRYKPFEIFARAQSMRYFERISKMLGGVGRDQFVQLVTQLTKDHNYSSLPRWEFDYLPLGGITGVAKLGTTS